MTHIGFSAWSLLDLLLVGGVTFDSQLDLFQASLPEHQLGHFSVLHVLEEPAGMAVEILQLLTKIFFMGKGNNGKVRHFLFLLYNFPSKMTVLS